MSRKPSLKHQKGSYCFSRVSKSLTLENCNMQPLVTTTLITHTELCTLKLPEPEPTADSLIVSIPLQKLPSQVAIVCSQTVRARTMQSGYFHPFGPVQRCTSGLPCIPYEESSLKGVFSRVLSFPQAGCMWLSSVATELVICKMEMKEESKAHFELSKISVGSLLRWVERWSY